jgi:FAD/FMN-containing dehydrogenase
VFAESAADVVHAVRFARSQGMRIAPQGTGHGSEPLESLEGVMLLRTVRMRRVGIDPARFHAWRAWS